MIFGKPGLVFVLLTWTLWVFLGGRASVDWSGPKVIKTRGEIWCSPRVGENDRITDIDISGPDFDQIPMAELGRRIINAVCRTHEI